MKALEVKLQAELQQLEDNANAPAQRVMKQITAILEAQAKAEDDSLTEMLGEPQTPNLLIAKKLSMWQKFLNLFRRRKVKYVASSEGSHAPTK